MTNVFHSIRDFFAPVQPLPAGMYHYISPPDDTRDYRLHLRIEPDGSGILIVNASTILHLNQTAAEHAYCIVKNMPPAEAARRFAARYHVTKDQALADYQNLVDRIQLLINTPDLDPETFLEFDRKNAHAGRISAPYRLDCALTYRLPEQTLPEAAPVERVKRELTLAEWKKILDKAAGLGIPHIVFTGGEPTLRSDLAQLIAYAEANNQITGLISDGLRFIDAGYLNDILAQGLDHMMMVFDHSKEQAWRALENLLNADIFVAVHLTLAPETFTDFPDLLARLVELGVKSISLSTNNLEMKDQVETARNQVAACNRELVWNLPVPYSALHPVALETGDWGSLPGAGRDWLYIEPDGDTLPTQGMNQVLGNFLDDPWEKIWKK